MFAVVVGFIRTYLTATNGLDRYVVAGAPLRPIGGYQSAVVSAAATNRSVPEAPVPGEQLHVRATVIAQTSQFATVNLVYPLTLENSGRKSWMVSARDLVPQVGGNSEADPVVKPHN